MPNLFKLPSGKRVSITTPVIYIEFPDIGAKGVLKTDVTYDATATDQFKQEPDGTWRRLFVDASIDFGVGAKTIWLSSDDPDDLPDFVEQPKQEEWDEEIFI